MEYTLTDKYKLINEEVKKHTSKNPITIAISLMKKDFVNVHGPEHHYLDGACFLVAYANAGGKIELDSALSELAERTIKMPGAMCGHWGVCGSTTSVGSALSIIHEVGPLSATDYYKDDMQYTSMAINKMSAIGGPRCCKRNAFLSLSQAVQFVKEKYKIDMELTDVKCGFYSLNKQCIGIRCPYFSNEKEN